MGIGQILAIAAQYPEWTRISIGTGIFLIGFAFSMRITPPPNDNLGYLLFWGKYVDAATGRSNSAQQRVDDHAASIADRAADVFDEITRSKPPLLLDPTTGKPAYLIQGRYWQPGEVLRDIQGHAIPDSWGTDVDLGALETEILHSHLDANGDVITDTTHITQAQNASSYNDPRKAQETGNMSPTLSVAGQQFLERHSDIIFQAYPNKTASTLTDDDLVHVYNILAGARADRRASDEGEGTRVNLTKWARMTEAQKGDYEATRIRNSQKWKTTDERHQQRDQNNASQSQQANSSGTSSSSSGVSISRRAGK